jgi:hypothetical protein
MLRLLFILLSLFVTLLAAERCRSYLQSVRVASYSVFGVDFPYWYNIGQLKQESGCRDVISNDGVGSQGVAQITYRVWRSYLKKHNINGLQSIDNQLLAQAWILKNCKKQAYSSHLWVMYQIYNGGSMVNKEIVRARQALGIKEVSHDIARHFCKRRTITFLNGTKRSACDINYEYSKKVYKYGSQYRLFAVSHSQYIFW